jgi:hypothetical protein
MFVKINKDGGLDIAPTRYMIEDGVTLDNFELFVNQYGFKQLIVEPQPLFDPSTQMLDMKYDEDDSFITQKWELRDMVDLDQYKQERITMMNNLCNETILNGFTSQGYKFIFDIEAQDNFTQQLLFLVVNPTIETVIWKTEDKGVVTLTKGQFMQVINDAQSHKMLYQNKYWGLKDKILKASSIPDVQQYNW